jgi:glycosyltransferase involved in cell wall biosynthesis
MDVQYPLSIVVPVHNEEECIRRVLEELLASLEGVDFEVILVDDGSTDRTAGTIDGMISCCRRIRLLRLGGHFGKGAALSAGIAAASNEVIVTLDGDGQIDPADVLRVAGCMSAGLDLVHSYRTRRVEKGEKWLASGIFNFLVGIFFRTRSKDNNSPLNAFRKSAVRGICFDYGLYRFIVPVALVRGLKVAHVGVGHRPRMGGNSKYGIGRLVRGAVTLPIAFSVAYLGIRIPSRTPGSPGLGARGLPRLQTVKLPFHG